MQSRQAGVAGSPHSPAVPLYVGYRWTLAGVLAGETNVITADGLGAYISFSENGTIIMSDSANTLSGRYANRSSGFSVHDVGTTLKLYAGDDADRKVVIAAMDTIAYGPMSNGTSSPTVTVSAQVTSGRLVIDVDKYQLTFTRSSPVASAPAPATGTPTA